MFFSVYSIPKVFVDVTMDDVLLGWQKLAYHTLVGLHPIILG